MGLLYIFIFNEDDNNNDKNNLTDTEKIMEKIEELNQQDENYEEIKQEMIGSTCKNETNGTNFSQEEVDAEYQDCIKKVEQALKSGITGQLKESSIKTVFRPFTKNQQDSYKILSTTQSASESQCIEDEYTQCGEKQESENQQPEETKEYNVQFIVESTSTTDYNLIVIPNYENSTYDFSSQNDGERRFLQDEDSEDDDLDEIDLTEAMDNSDAIPENFKKEMDAGLQLNIIKCQILRSGIVEKCWWPTNMNTSLLSIAIEALNQYTPILDKQYSTIKTEAYSNSGNRRILESSAVLQEEETPFKVENAKTGSYKKKNEIVIQEDLSSNLTNATSLKMQNSFEQSDFGSLYGSGESKEMFQQVDSAASMDPMSGQISESSTNGKFHFKGNEVNSSENNNTQSIKKLDVKYEVKLELTQSKQLNQDDVDVILNMSKILKYEVLIDPINNKTFMSQFDSGISEEDINPEALRLLASYEEIASLKYPLFKQNLIGIDVTGQITVKCFANDQCFIGIGLDLGGVIEYYPIKKTFKAKISTINNRYQYLRYYVLNNIQKVCSQLVNTKADFYADASNVVNYFKQVGQQLTSPLKQTAQKYNNILSKLATSFGSLSDLVPNLQSVIKKEFMKSVSTLFGKYYLEKDKFTQILFQMENYVQQTKELLTSVQLEETDQIMLHIKQFQKSLKDDLLDYVKTSVNERLDAAITEFDAFSGLIDQQFISIADSTDIIPDHALGQTVLQFFTERLNPFQELSQKLISSYTENIKMLINLEHSFFETQLDQYFEELYTVAKQVKGESQSLTAEATDHIQELFCIEDIDTLKYSGIETLYELDVDIQESLKGIITIGFQTFYTGLKQMFVDSKNIFTEIFDGLGDDAKRISDSYVTTFKNFLPGFENVTSTAWNNLVDNIKEIGETFKVISNINFTPSKGEIKKIVKGNLLSAPNEIIKTFKGLKNVWDEFSNIADDLQGLLEGKEIIGARRLGVLDIFSDLKDDLTTELNNMKTSFMKAKNEMMSLSQTMNIVGYTIDEFDFDFVKDSICDVVEDIAGQIVDEIQDAILEKAKNFIKDEFSELFDLENLLDTTLSSFLPGESELLYSLGFEWSKSVTLGVIPIVIGVVKVDAYIKYFHAIDITYGFEGGALFIGVGPHAGVSMGLTAYADFFILRIGMFVEGTLFEGAVDFKLGIQVLNKLSAFFYCDLEITALKFAVGSWLCFKIKFWFFSIKLCFPIIWFAWTPWEDLFRFEIVGLSYKRSLIPRTEIDILK